MKRKHRVKFITIVPSPYQRDLFEALASRPDIELSVYYMEMAAPDSPWPQAPLRSFEHRLPGFWFPAARTRWHVNWKLPDTSDADFVVLSTYASLTGQYLMSSLKGKRWLFWGERLRSQEGIRAYVQGKLAAPLAGATAIVGIGRAAESDYQSRFPGVHHYCIPYHCELSGFLASPRPKPSKRLRFLFCGQMIHRKGVDLLIHAFDELVRAGHDIELLLVGREAELPQFLAEVSAGTRERILYEGFQPPGALPGFFSRADVFVIPSRHDGWGVVVNQALAAGLPIITSEAVGAGLDLVEHEVNGLRVTAGSLIDLQRAMEKMSRDRELASIWGGASRKRALLLTPEVGAKKWASVFDELNDA